MKPKTVGVFCFSVILSVCGLCLIVLWPKIFNCALSLKCNPILFQLWKNIPVTIENEFYLFNWTNPEDIYNVSVKPKFEEIGPYVFSSKEEKCDIVWNDNDTVTFRQRKFYWFDEEKTIERSLQDKITTVNPTILAISYMSRTWNYYVRKGLFLTLSKFFPTIHRTQTAQELLFDGYPEPMLKVASAMPFLSHLDLPSWPRFGWMYDRNGSTEFDGIMNMGTGSNSVLGKLHSWNYKSKTGYFKGDCGKVSGSTGQIFPRNIDHDPMIVAFSPDLRRTIAAKFAHETIVNNILGYTYVAEDYMLDNGTIRAENECFCSGECIPTGLANLSLTRSQSPLFESLPHFYGADPYYLGLVDGLKPDKKKHEFSITIEPTTGIVLEANPKMQINLLMQPVTGTELYDNAPKVFLPILWTQQKAKIQNKEAFVMKLLLAIPAASVSLGATMILTSAALLFHQVYLYQKIQKKSPQQNQIEESVPLKVNQCSKISK